MPAFWGNHGDARAMPRSRSTTAALAAAAALLAWAGLALAGLPAPRFLPGQPVVVGKQVLLMWLPVPGASAYLVYRDGVRLERLTANQYLGALPEQSGQYRYQVSALDAAGIEGERSEAGLVRVRALTPPRNLLAQPDPATGTVSLLWDSVDGAVVYNLYRSAPGEERRLLASVPEESYRDADVKPGVEYAYTVTARDPAGTEGPASEPAKATLAAAAPAKPSPETAFRAMPTEEVLSLDELAGARIAQVSDLRVGPGGNLWVVTPDTRQIHVVSPDGVVLSTLGPFNFTETGYALLPQKLSFGRKGRVFVSDAVNGVLACLDRFGAFLWARGILAPPPNADEVWEELPANLRTLPPTPSSVLCLEDEIWVTDQRFQILYRFDYSGNLTGYTAYYTRGSKTARLPAVGEATRLGADRLLLTFPLSHRAAVVDRALYQVAELGVAPRGYIGAFVGIHGVTPLRGGRALLVDPAVGTLQVFDTATGKYLYHVSGPEPRLDPAYPQRADLPLRKPNFAALDLRGRFWVYDAATRRIAVLEPSGDVTPALGP